MFKSIPFATARRFELPEPIACWPADGVDATCEQRAAWQSNQPQPDGVQQTEDCLTLTIRHRVGAAKLPVMVWIHGGNHQDGRAEQPEQQHGNSLPSNGVVLVKLQYRLGLFGYFAHPEIPHTNFGTWDQVMALKWVHDHIASFGGDPNNVTIFGVSAGGDSVAHMLISPHAAGLFHRAILQSPNVSHQFVYWRQAAMGYMPAIECGKNFADELVGHQMGQLDRLRAMPADELAAAYSAKKGAALGAPGGATSDWQGFWPCVDGDVIPDVIFRAVQLGCTHHVPLIVGSNSDEGQGSNSLYYSDNPAEYILTPEVIGWTHPHPLPDHPAAGPQRDAYGGRRMELAAMYPGLATGRTEAMAMLMADSLFNHKARWYAQHARSPAWLYSFNRQQPGPPWLGALHGMEQAFVLGDQIPEPSCLADETLAETIQTFWTNFAKSGDPNRPVRDQMAGQPLPMWPQYHHRSRLARMMALDHIVCSATPVVRAAILDIHDIFLREACASLPELDSPNKPTALSPRSKM